MSSIWTQSGTSLSLELTTLAQSCLTDESKNIYEQFLRDHPWISYLNARNRVTEDGGEIILRHAKYRSGRTGEWFERNDTLHADFQETRVPFSTTWKNYAQGIIIPLMDLIVAKNNSWGPALDVIAEQTEDAVAAMEEGLNAALLGDGTGHGNKVCMGLQGLVRRSPTSGALFGLDSALWSFWRNASYNVGTYATADAATASWLNYGFNGQEDDLYSIAKTAISEGSMKPDLLLSGPTLQMYYGHQVLNNFVQVSRTDADIGRMAVILDGMTWVTDKMLEDLQIHPAGNLYMLNSKTLELVVSNEWNMKNTGFKDLTANQRLAMICFILFRCNFIITQPMFNAVIHGYTAEL